MRTFQQTIEYVLPSSLSLKANRCTVFICVTNLFSELQYTIYSHQETKRIKIANYKRSYKLIEAEIERQEENIKLSIIGKGQWKVAEQYSKELEISEETFYRMTVISQDLL